MSSLTSGERLTTCSHCDELKPESEFSPRKDHPGSVTSWCLKCMREQKQARRESERLTKPVTPVPTEKLCLGKCTRTLPIDHFGWKDKKAGRLREKCRECHNEETRNAKATNREFYRQQGRVYYADNRLERREAAKQARIAEPERFRATQARSRKKNRETILAGTHRRRTNIAGGGGSHTASERRAMEARYGWRCLQCGGEKPLTFDHVIPVDPPYRGSSDISNAQPMCRPHNGAKRNRILDLRPGSIYDLRPDLPIGTVDLAMADLPVPKWVAHPKWEKLANRTEKLCSGPFHEGGVLVPLEMFPIRSSKSGKHELVAYCRDCKNERQRTARKSGIK